MLCPRVRRNSHDKCCQRSLTVAGLNDVLIGKAIAHTILSNTSLPILVLCSNPNLVDSSLEETDNRTMHDGSIVSVEQYLLITTDHSGNAQKSRKFLEENITNCLVRIMELEGHLKQSFAEYTQEEITAGQILGYLK